jgi:hypothetical protein
MWKIPVIPLAGFNKRLSSTGSPSTALNSPAIESPGLAQGSGSLQANEAISYGTVPLQYSKSPVPDKRNVGKPLHQHTNFVPATQQRQVPRTHAKVPRGGGS